MATRMQQRRGTASQWTSSNSGAGPVLNAGEIGWESDTNKFKIGDGVSNWTSLTYFVDATDVVAAALGSYLQDSDKGAVSGVAELNASQNLLVPGTKIIFEGTDDAYETEFVVTDPAADVTLTFPNATDTIVGRATTDTLTNKTLTSPTVSGLTLSDSSIIIEGSTANEFETTLTVTDPTADRTITLPDATGTVQLRVTDVSDTEIGYLNGVTSAIQTQMDLKAPLAAPALTGDATAVNLTVSGNLTVNGTTTNINSTNLVVEDKNIILGDAETPTDTTADGGGITLKGATDKTFNWVDATDAWTSSEHINLASGKVIYLNGTAETAATQTLTNKTIALGSNTVSGTLAQFNTAVTDADLASLAGTETLTNKTLTAPIFTNSINTQTGTTYTTVLSDAAALITLNNASAITLSIPTNASVAYAVGTQINVAWITGAGQPTISATTPGTTTILSTGSTSTAPKLRVANSVATCIKIATDTWLVTGDLA
jgi:hypothetical protein